MGIGERARALLAGPAVEPARPPNAAIIMNFGAKCHMTARNIDNFYQKKNTKTKKHLRIFLNGVRMHLVWLRHCIAR